MYAGVYFPFIMCAGVNFALLCVQECNFPLFCVQECNFPLLCAQECNLTYYVCRSVQTLRVCIRPNPHDNNLMWMVDVEEEKIDLQVSLLQGKSLSFMIYSQASARGIQGRRTV